MKSIRPNRKRLFEVLTALSLALFTLVAWVSTAAPAPTPQTQAIPLYTGWNLISVQVGNSLSMPQFQNALQTPGALQEVWAYEAINSAWLTYQAATPSYPHELTNVAPGRGYWVKVGQNTSLIVTGATWSGGVTLIPGWNLIGFPGLGADAVQGLEFSSVLRTNLNRIPQVWTFEGGAPQQFVGYDSSALPPITNLFTIESGQGYWVYSLDLISLAPSPQIILPGDIDIPPLQVVELFEIGRTNNPGMTNEFRGSNADVYAGTMVKFVGPEDIAAGTDLNGNGILDDPFTQDTLIFKEGINQQLITIANDSVSVIDWLAFSDIPWLKLNGTNVIAGITASEFDYLTVTVDRTGLLPGIYTNSFYVFAGNLAREVKAILRVPAVDGDWRGYATTVRVNGQPISIGKVDLNMTIFSKTTNITEKNIQGVINRELSLLFPRDVFMTGTFYQDNDFFLSTNFEVPTGDRNAPPFDVFSHGNSGGNTNWSADIDLNRDGKLDNSNPFPFPLRREITLIGRRVNENQLVGSYYESIQNVLPAGQRINIEGEFQLDRLSLTPTLTSIYNKNVPTNLIIGASSPAAITNTITVTPSVTVQGVVVNANLDFALGSGVTLTLVGPNSQSVQLDNQAFSGSRTYTLNNFNGIDGQGAWKLIVRWSPNGERGYFQGWQLNVQGLAVYQATGKIVTGSTNNTVAGARVTLTGNNFVDQRFTPTNGVFTFTNLTENDFTLTVSKVGYQDAQANFSIIASNVSLGNIFLVPATNTAPELLALPYAGGEPLNVNFRTTFPLTVLSNYGTILSNVWRFGDGTTTNYPGEIASEGEHTYVKPGYYFATNTVYGSGGSTSLVSRLITVIPASVPTGWTNAYFLSSVGFVGSIGSSVQPSVNGLEAPVIGHTNVTVTVNGTNVILTNVATAALFQESKRDPAGFDLDRYPFGNFVGSEDTDSFPIGGGYQPFPRLPVVGNATNRFRMTTTMGGYVFGEAPSRVGIFVLQPSRLEP